MVRELGGCTVALNFPSRVPLQPAAVVEREGMEKSQAKALEQRLFKRRIVDKSLPQSIQADFSSLSSMYSQLVEKERQIDFRLIKKQLDIQEASFKLFKLRRILKVFLTSFYTTEANESFPATFEEDLVGFPDTTDVGAFYWTLRIDGRLMDFPPSSKYPVKPPPPKKFSSFIKSIHVELDPTKYPNDGFLEWTKVQLSPESDGFEIKRKFVPSAGTSFPVSIPVKVYIQLDTGTTEKFKLNSALSAVLSKQAETKPQIIMGLWQYVKLHKLQDTEDRRIINCDDLLRNAFGQERINFASLPELILGHLGPLDPIELEYTIQLDPTRREFVQEGPLVEVEVEIEDWSKPRLPSLLSSLATTKEITLLDQKINEVLFAIHKAAYKTDFMTKFSKDPAQFLNNWIVNQARYLEDALGSTGGMPEEMRMSEFFAQPWVADMVTHYLDVKP